MGGRETRNNNNNKNQAESRISLSHLPRPPTQAVVSELLFDLRVKKQFGEREVTQHKKDYRSKSLINYFPLWAAWFYRNMTRAFKLICFTGKGNRKQGEEMVR